MVSKSKMQQWRKEVGALANVAALAKSVTPSGASGSGTLPELLMEGALVQRGATYKTQVALGFTRADCLVLNQEGTGWIMVSVDGDYWHKDQHGHDYGKDMQVLGFEVDGFPIVQTVRALESDIKTQLDWVADSVMRGEQVRVLS